MILNISVPIKFEASSEEYFSIFAQILSLISMLTRINKDFLKCVFK